MATNASSLRDTQENDTSDRDSDCFIVSDSDDDQLASIENLYPIGPSTSYKETSNEPLKEQMIPMFHRGIKRSIDHFSKGSSNKESDESEKTKDNKRLRGIVLYSDDDDSNTVGDTETKNRQVVQSYQDPNANAESGSSPRQFSPVQQTPKNWEMFDTDSNESENSMIGLTDGSEEDDSSDSNDSDWCDDKENYLESLPRVNFVKSMARQKMKKKPLNSVISQKKNHLIFQRDWIQKELEMTRGLLTPENLPSLPDNGTSLLERIKNHENELERTERDLAELHSQEAHFDQEKKPLFMEGSLDIDPTYLMPTTSTSNKTLGKKAQETLEREQSLTVERLKDLHGSIVSRPTDNEKAEDPQGLRVPLMPHQKHALAWLFWRETQKPRGGILADDMGLGKTLTMISLVLASIARRNAGETSDNEKERLTSSRFHRHLGGTLVVAPASLVSQWESEVNNRCKRSRLSVELYHGNNREKNPQRLARNDIVITTYGIVSRSLPHNGILFKIRWRRVILDEAHIIRNHKKNTCESVCRIDADRRWALTGTPIQNKQMDLFAVMKFLRCTPFDDMRVWKRWVDNSNSAGYERLATVLKSIMLRRTKLELQAKGGLQRLPNKTIEIINFDLDDEERPVYDKLMLFSSTIFAQFLQQRAEKAHMFQYGVGRFDQISWKSTGQLLAGNSALFNKAQLKLLFAHLGIAGHHIGAHHILVLLLRLRQVCCHPSLIHTMLDKDDIGEVDLENFDNPGNLLSIPNDLSFSDDDEESEGEMGVDERVGENLLTSVNPVFDEKRQSSKMRVVLEKIQELMTTNDKIIVVSQWTSVLDILAAELDDMEEVTYKMFTGKVAVKDRQGIIDDFNLPRSETNVLLLSLTAGGIGLNLVGANRMLLIDNHWNPQLECQAQDRIYRFGQTKDVYIYKYLCTDTIEERIKALQDRKLEIATNVLDGGENVMSSRLTLEDMKTLFGL